MSEYLTVRLSSQPSAPIQWLVWSSIQNEVIASGELSSPEQITTLQPYAQQRTTIALLSGQDVHLHQVEIPNGGKRQLMTILPYLLEDELAQDVDKLHFHLLHTEGNQAQICAVEKAYLAKWLDDFKQAGIDIAKVLPDVLALPQQQEGVSALQIGDEWLFRRGSYQAISVDNAWFELFCNSEWLQENDTIFSYTPLPQTTDTRWQLADQLLIMELLATQAINSKINLLSAQFKRHSSWLKQWQQWKKVAIAIVILLLSFFAKNSIETQHYQQQAQAYRAESEQIFRTIFTDKKRIPTVSYLKREMNDEVARLSGTSTSNSLLAWLSDLPAAMSAASNMEIQNIKYDGTRNEIRLQAKSTNFENFEVVRVKLSEKFNVVQGQLNRNGDAVYGSFILTPLNSEVK